MIFILLFVLSFSLTYFLRHYFLHKKILDIPNERSSHSTPTPRGGGLGIAISFFAGLAFLYHLKIVPENILLALSGGILIAFIGWLDDIYSLAARWRLLFHILSAIWALYWLRDFTSLNIGFSVLNLSWAGPLLGVLGIVWSINFYNFMDGIDGLSGSEAIFVSSAAGLFLLAENSALSVICFLLIPATLGFLIWNWPKAKIFMGDVGSSLLGYIFAVLAIASENQHSFPLLAWIILLSVFAFDTTFTLISRVKRREAIHTAHREHAYQQLSKLGFSHLKITLSILFFNIFVVLPFAFIAFKWPTLLLPSLLLVIGILFWIWKTITLSPTLPPCGERSTR